MDRILRMIINRVIGQLVRRGVDAGINRAARGTTREEDMTRKQRAQVRQTTQRARQLSRTARRFTRF